MLRRIAAATFAFACGLASPASGQSDADPFLEPAQDVTPTFVESETDSVGAATWVSGEQPVTEPIPESEELYETYCPTCESDPPFTSDLPWIVPYAGRATATWIAGSGNRLGMTDLDLSTTLIFPEAQELSVTPTFRVRYLDGPIRTDMPPRLFDAMVAFGWRKQWNDKWRYAAVVAPGVYSDFERDNDDALRITGRGLAFYRWSETVEFMFGAAYLDREDVRVLPVFGLVVTPNDDVKWEIVFPRPKLAARFLRGSDRDHWIYVGGEFGGGSWAVERVTGLRDTATYRDWRLISGLETKFHNGWSSYYEVGYVFNRSLEYDSRLGEYDPDDTIMLRVGISR